MQDGSVLFLIDGTADPVVVTADVIISPPLRFFAVGDAPAVVDYVASLNERAATDSNATSGKRWSTPAMIRTNVRPEAIWDAQTLHGSGASAARRAGDLDGDHDRGGGGVRRSSGPRDRARADRRAPVRAGRTGSRTEGVLHETAACNLGSGGGAIHSRSAPTRRRDQQLYDMQERRNWLPSALTASLPNCKGSSAPHSATARHRRATQLFEAHRANPAAGGTVR
jgi:hypothetical protein